jgi:hypothetical protein
MTTNLQITYEYTHNLKKNLADFLQVRAKIGRAYEAGVGKPHYRRFRRRATPAKRGIGPGCRPTEVGGAAGRLRAAGRVHGR